MREGQTRAQSASSDKASPPQVLLFQRTPGQGRSRCSFYHSTKTTQDKNELIDSRESELLMENSGEIVPLIGLVH